MFKEKPVSLRDIRESFLMEIAYWEHRRSWGDIFLDGTDGWDLAKEGIALLDRFEKAGYDTGKAEFHKPKHMKEDEDG